MKILLIKFLKKISRVIWFLTPVEFKPKTLLNPSGVTKLLHDKNDAETIEILGDDLKNCKEFDDIWKLRLFAIEMAIANEKKLNLIDQTFFLEFGVWEGKSSNFFSKYIQHLYVFDSFEGLREEMVGMEPAGKFSLNKKLPRLRKNITPTIGWVEDTLENFLEEHQPMINFAHLDMDLYSPTKFTLQKIKPFLLDGAILLFDEFYNYLNWQDGEYKALIEVFKKNEYKYVAYNIASGQLFIQISKEDAKI